MSVVNLLLLFVIWMSWTPEDAPRAWFSPAMGPFFFLGGYLVLVAAVGLWSRRLARGVSNERIIDGLRRFNWVVAFAQMMVPAWLGVGTYFLGWGSRVESVLGGINHWGLAAPGLLLGISPAVLAWMGLWCAQYPVDFALREQNVISRLTRDMPVYAPPGFWVYFVGKLRMQLLLILVPVFLIAVLRDTAGIVIRWFGIAANSENIDAIRWGGSMAWVFFMGPEVMRRVLATEVLPDPELRARLKLVSDRAGIRARVLLWRTHHTVGNALVMGPVAWFRYVLLSDLLLECLTDDEVSAVFAHEVGHIRHRHMIWYAAFFIALGLALFGLNDLGDRVAVKFGFDPRNIDNLFPALQAVLFFVCFGFLSRRFERQADVYAARTLEAMKQSTGANQPTFVGPEGARIFNSALSRVAEVNNVPLETRGRFAGNFRQRIRFLSEWFGNLGVSWLHGTMASRMRYINGISADPDLTAQFDVRMRRTKGVLIAMLVVFGAWAGWAMYETPGDVRLSPQGPAGAHAVRLTAPTGNALIRPAGG